MVAAAQGHRELIADLATKCPALGKTQMMSVAGPASAHQTRLLGDKPHMVAIADAPRLGVHQHRFIDRWRWRGGLCLLAPSIRSAGGRCILVRFRRSFREVDGKGEQFGAKRLLNVLGIGRVELVLFR